MKRSTGTTHQLTRILVAGLFGLAAVALAPGTAQASRIPADPVAFVPTPMQVVQLVTDAHAATVLTQIRQLRADIEG